jgi:antitoxin component YwqK of YwqJK toxin-antitoxin module
MRFKLAARFAASITVSAMIYDKVTKDGMKEGIEKSYYESGKLKSELFDIDTIPFVEQQLIHRSYYENGKVKEERFRVNSGLETRRYGRDGKIIANL